MEAKDVARRVASCGPDEWAINAPWLALPWKVPESWPEALPVEGRLMDIMESHCETAGTDWAVGVVGV